VFSYHTSFLVDRRTIGIEADIDRMYHSRDKTEAGENDVDAQVNCTPIMADDCQRRQKNSQNKETTISKAHFSVSVK